MSSAGTLLFQSLSELAFLRLLLRDQLNKHLAFVAQKCQLLDLRERLHGADVVADPFGQPIDAIREVAAHITILAYPNGGKSTLRYSRVRTVNAAALMIPTDGV